MRTSAEGKESAGADARDASAGQTLGGYSGKARRSTAPSLVFEEEGRTVGVIRDLFNPSFENIYVNDADTFDQLHDYVQHDPAESRYSQTLCRRGSHFDHFGVTRQIKTSFGKTVSFRSGSIHYHRAYGGSACH